MILLWLYHMKYKYDNRPRKRKLGKPTSIFVEKEKGQILYTFNIVMLFYRYFWNKPHTNSKATL